MPSPTKRGRALAESAQRWAERAEGRANIAHNDGSGPVVGAALAAAVAVAYAAASIAWTWTDDS